MICLLQELASVRGCSFGCLVETPFCDFKKAFGKNCELVAHEQKEYHKVSVLRASFFMECNAASRVDVQMLQQQENEFTFIEAALEKKVLTV